jgi:hypothetical protein
MRARGREYPPYDWHYTILLQSRRIGRRTDRRRCRAQRDIPLNPVVVDDCAAPANADPEHEEKRDAANPLERWDMMTPKGQSCR